MRSLPVASAASSPPPFSDEVTFAPLGPRPRVLLVWPRLPASFWGFESMLTMLPERSLIPPLGLMTVAALCPPGWQLRLIDEAIEPLGEADLAAADLVLVSAMHAQRERLFAILALAKERHVRTMVGGPYASTEPEVLLERADHVVVGEADKVFDTIAGDLERGRARRLYLVQEKPDLDRTPVPRFDLLDLRRYACMPVQFSRGCPFQCEFCDIITIYGRKPRSKPGERLIAELDRLHALGWSGLVFIVDDNFIGHHRNALSIAREIADWQARHDQPFAFFTEASVDLAERPELIEAMVQANFLHVFLGIESPSAEALKETRKLQNLRRDPFESVLHLQRRGLWVIGGFIVGFDSDTESIFEAQRALIERSAIPWAMTGFLMAPPTTPLFDRVRREGRLLEESAATSNFNIPNFRTTMARDVLVGGLSKTLAALYEPTAFYRRAARSLAHWRIRKGQRAPRIPLTYRVKAVLRSIWRQGVCSRYRRAYWRFLVELLYRWHRQPEKLWWGFTLLMSGEHFIGYSAAVIDELGREPQ